MSLLFAFLDLETTGLNPDEDTVLEVAWFLADQTLTQVTEDRTFLVAPYASFYHRAECLTVVENMHEESGLWEALDMRLPDQRPNLAAAHQQMAMDINSVIQPGDTLHLAGLSVHFDKAFLHDYPGWEMLFRDSSEDDGMGLKFNHRLLDLSPSKLLYKVAGRDLPEIEPNPNAHRAINDCHEALDMARALAGELVSL